MGCPALELAGRWVELGLSIETVISVRALTNWHYMGLGGLWWSNVLNSALSSQRLRSDTWPEHQDPAASRLARSSGLYILLFSKSYHQLDLCKKQVLKRSRTLCVSWEREPFCSPHWLLKSLFMVSVCICKWGLPAFIGISSANEWIGRVLQPRNWNLDDSNYWASFFNVCQRKVFQAPTTLRVPQENLMAWEQEGARGMLALENQKAELNVGSLAY